MKLFAFIMAFLVLTLSALPCADIITDGQQTIEIATNQSQPDQDHNDACSPLCHCSCCAGFSLNHFIPSLINNSLILSNVSHSFLSSDVIQIAATIWQPPN